VNTAQAQQLAATAVLVAGGLTVVSYVADRQTPPLRVGLGVVIAGVCLSTLAEVAPDVAGPLAILVLTSAVFVHGGPAARAFTRATT